jgi:hypothetical protein
MKPQFFPVTAVLLATALVPMLHAAPAQAETSNNPLADFQTQGKSSDPFAGSSDSTSGMMDLIHRAMQGPMPDMGAFRAANRENLNDAASAFRAKQQKLLQQRQAAQGGSPQELKTVPSGTILLPGALSATTPAGGLILAPNTDLPTQAVPAPIVTP